MAIIYVCLRHKRLTFNNILIYWIWLIDLSNLFHSLWWFWIHVTLILEQTYHGLNLLIDIYKTEVNKTFVITSSLLLSLTYVMLLVKNKSGLMHEAWRWRKTEKGHSWRYGKRNTFYDNCFKAGVIPLCSFMILWVTLSTEHILLLKSSTYSCMMANSSSLLLSPRTELAMALMVSPILLRKPGPSFLWGASSCTTHTSRLLKRRNHKEFFIQFSSELIQIRKLIPSPFQTMKEPEVFFKKQLRFL